MRRIFIALALMVIGVPSYGQATIVHYNFSGGAATDSGPWGLNGTLNGGITSVAGRGGVANTALHFDGSTGFVSVPSSSHLELPSNWTFICVFKPDTFYSGTCQAMRLLQHGSESSSNYYCLEITDNAYDHSCGTYSPNNQTIETGFSGNTAWNTYNAYLLPGHWYCYASTYDGDTLRYYLDGTLVYKLKVTSAYASSTYAGLSIGKQTTNASYPYWFHGSIDDMAIYSEVFTPTIVNKICDDISNGGGRYIRVPATGFTVSPNPTTGAFTITIPSEWQTDDIRIMNYTGQTVITQKFSGDSQTMDLSQLSAGIYMVVVRHDGILTTQKVVKQ